MQLGAMRRARAVVEQASLPPRQLCSQEGRLLGTLALRASNNPCTAAVCMHDGAKAGIRPLPQLASRAAQLMLPRAAADSGEATAVPTIRMQQQVGHTLLGDGGIARLQRCA